MTPQTIALINLIAKVGLDTAIVIVEEIGSPTSNEEAVAALKRARDKSAEQYLADAKAAAGKG